MQIKNLSISLAAEPRVDVGLNVDSALLFEPDAQLQVLSAEGQGVLYSQDLSGSLPVPWLPRGEYGLCCHLHDLVLPA
jgi:hypothetical protein